MKRAMPSAVLFDLDGTLVDTAPDFFAVVNDLRQESDLPHIAHSSIRQQVSNGGSALTRLTWQIELDHPEFDYYRQQLLARYEQHIGSASALFPGFEQVLSDLQAAGIHWGIVTNKPRRYTELLLERLPLDCPIVVCPDDVSRAKPDPEPLLLAASQLEVSASQCWYVGDHQRDIDAGQAAGMFTLGCRFGYLAEPAEADQWGADAVLDTALELSRLLFNNH